MWYTSAAPAVPSSRTGTPRRSRNALMPWVVPCTRKSMSDGSSTTASRPASTPSLSCSGVVDALVAANTPAASSYVTTSVNVPPMSIDTRYRVMNTPCRRQAILPGKLRGGPVTPLCARHSRAATARATSTLAARPSAQRQGSVVEVRQHVPGEQVSLCGMRIAGQDEGVHAQVGVGLQFGQHLVRVADDRGTSAGARAADAGPQVRLHIPAVIGYVAQLVLPQGPRGCGVEGTAAD